VVLREQVEENPCQTIAELSYTLNQPWSTIQEHLRQIGKVNRAGVWVPHNLSEVNKANRFSTCKLLLQRHKTEPFFDCLITGDEKGFAMIMSYSEGSGSLPVTCREVLLNLVYIQKRRFYVFGGVFAESFISNC